MNVLDICERAEVGRSTFYTHFAHKEALLLSGYDDLREHLRAERAAHARGPLAFLPGLIEHVFDNRRLFRALVGKRAGHLAIGGFRRFVLDMVSEDLANDFAKMPNLEPVARYVSGGISELLIWSVDARPATDAVELEALCLQFTQPILARLRK